MGKHDLQSSWERDRWIGRGTLLSQATGSVNGVWQPLRGARPFTITVGGVLATGTVRILVSNTADRPPDYTRAQLTEDITSKAALLFESPWEWICAITVSVDGPLDVDIKVG